MWLATSIIFAACRVVRRQKPEVAPDAHEADHPLIDRIVAGVCPGDDKVLARVVEYPCPAMWKSPLQSVGDGLTSPHIPKTVGRDDAVGSQLTATTLPRSGVRDRQRRHNRSFSGTTAPVSRLTMRFCTSFVEI